MKTLQDYIDKLNSLNFKEMYENDFFLTWEKTDDELEAVWTVADALRYMRENNISTKVFESGLGISLFRDNSTRTRFSFASACNLLGLEVQEISKAVVFRVGRLGLADLLLHLGNALLELLVLRQELVVLEGVVVNSLHPVDQRVEAVAHRRGKDPHQVGQGVGHTAEQHRHHRRHQGQQNGCD